MNCYRRGNVYTILIQLMTKCLIYLPLSCGDQSFQKAALSLWNDLAIQLPSTNNIDLFKKKHKTHLFTKYYDTV